MCCREYEALNRELFNGRRVMEFKSGEFKSRLYLGQTPRGLEKNAPVQPMMQGQMGQQMMYAQAVPQQAYPYNAPVAQPMPNDPKAGSRTMAITIPPNATPGSNMTVMSPEGMQIMVRFTANIVRLLLKDSLLGTSASWISARINDSC